MSDSKSDQSPTAIRQQRHRKKREAAGFKQVLVWVRAENVERLRAYARQLEVEVKGLPPTDRQLAYAKEISERTGVSISTEAFTSNRYMTKWISQHRQLPSSPEWLMKQKEFANKFESLIETKKFSSERTSSNGRNSGKSFDEEAPTLEDKISETKMAEARFMEQYNASIILGFDKNEAYRQAIRGSVEVLINGGWKRAAAHGFAMTFFKKPS